MFKAIKKFFSVRPLVIDPQKKLLHEILETLRFCAIEITGSGTEQNMYPIYELQLGSAELYLGTLAALVNNRNWWPKEFNGTFIREYKAKTREIDQSKYTLREISNALSVLKSNGDISITISNDSTEKKILLLTKGLHNLNSNHYLIEYEKEFQAASMYVSTISNSRWMTILTGILTVSTVIQVAFLFKGCGNQQDKTLKIEYIAIKDSVSAHQQPVIKEKIDTIPPLKSDSASSTKE